jgi:coenzyme F420-0:L-glutamate ligase / coenzyme F420-1:gamma-L-glutamate ligase
MFPSASAYPAATPSTDRVVLQALTPFPLVRPGDDLASILMDTLAESTTGPVHNDIVVVAQKVVSKAEGRYVDLEQIEPSSRAREIARSVKKDARFVEAVLRESRRIVRQAPGVLIVEHRLGFVMANAGIDRSNIDPQYGQETVLLLPHDPDRSAAALLERLEQRFRVPMGVIITDSFGRPWRRGTVGIALGAAGFPAIRDLRGQLDLFGRALRVTETGFADEVAAAASLLMGQSDEGQPAILVRGLQWSEAALPAASLVRLPDEDLFR